MGSVFSRGFAAPRDADARPDAVSLIETLRSPAATWRERSSSCAAEIRLGVQCTTSIASMHPMPIRRAAAIVALASTGAVAAAPAEGEIELSSADGESKVEMDSLSGRATSPSGVVATYRGTAGRTVTVYARAITFQRETEDIAADGDVTIQTVELVEGAAPAVQLFRGGHIEGNLRSQTFAADEFRSSKPPFFIRGSSLHGSGVPGTPTDLTDGIVTTEDRDSPAYRMQARRLRIIPGQYIEADGVRFYAGHVPFLAAPRWRRTLQGHERFWTLVPGYRSTYGPFLLSGYHWKVATNAEVGLNLDYRARRGPGLGPEIEYDLGRLGQGRGLFYWTHDDKAPDLHGIDEDRIRYQFDHRLTNGSGLELQGVLNGQRDPWVIHDFREGEFRRDPRPDTSFEASQAWRNFNVDLLARPQVNRFFPTVERLPDLKFNAFRQQLGGSPLFYEGDGSMAYLRRNPGLLDDRAFAAFRADTYHQVLLPHTFFGWLNLAPRAGGRFTYYTDPENHATIAEDRHRFVFNTGIEATARISRTWESATNRLFEISGLRHSIEPSLNYAYVPEPGRRPPELPAFDEELPSLRLLPVDFPDYNAIDSIDSENVLRFGLRNRLLTRREGSAATLLEWRTFTDWRLRPNAGQSTFPEVYSDLEFSPRRWIQFSSELRYDINATHWREANHRLTLIPNSTWQWTLGHRFLRDNEGGPGPGNNLFYSSAYYRLNENWAFRMSHHFEGRDGVLEEQYYTVYRDFRSWTGALTFRLRDNRRGSDDWAIVATFSLKAFPRYKLGTDRDRLERLLGG